MVVKTQKLNHESSKYTLTRKAGKSIIDHRPAFSPDEQSLAVIVENIVRIYDVQTGDLVRSLEADSNIDELIGICFDQQGHYLYGCSRCGMLITWTFENGTVLREFKLKLFGRKVTTFDLVDSDRFFITSVGRDNKIHLATFHLKIGVLETEFTNKDIPYFGSVKVAIGWFNKDRFAAISNLTKFLFIQNLDKAHVHAYHSNYNEFRILDVATHHCEPAIAVTDTLGRATIFRGNLFHYQEVAREVLHWHFLPAFAVQFSTSGGYLITGGMEKVLVKWSIANLSNKAGAKDLIPRLPGIVKYVAVSHSNIAITLSNNSVVIANALMRVHCTILECGGLSSVARSTGGALVYHKPTGCLFMGGRPGHLQMYSTRTDKMLFNLDITQMNSVPSESKSNLIPLETEVTCAAMNSLGTWLVTSEYRDDGVLYPEERLKFWASQSGPNSTVPFRLATCVNLSHGGSRVVSIALNSQGSFCVTAGLDQKFRIWKREQVQRFKKERGAWYCFTACYYSSGVAQFSTSSVYNDIKKFEVKNLFEKVELPYMKAVGRRDDLILKIMNMHKELTTPQKLESIEVDSETAMGGVAISQDGSLIAAWFGCKLTLWDTHLCNMKTTLSHPALRPVGKHVQFGSHDAAHYLVCTTDSCLAVFSVLSLSVKWLVPIRPTCLVADVNSNRMAIVTDQNDVVVFNPHSSTPIVKQNKVLEPRTGVINVCTFVQSAKYNEPRLYLMRNDSEIYCLKPEQSKKDRLEVISHTNLPTSNFGALLAEQQVSEVTPAQAGALDDLNQDALSSGAIQQFLSAAPHMLPPVSLICTEFLEQISGQKIAEESEDLDDSVMEVDPQSSDDETQETKETQEPRPQLWTPNYEAIKKKRLKKILSLPLLQEDAAGDIFGLSK
ncbi:WD repeat-containing protein 75 [Leguminivora glycinivorella]|uniref:WD repeat-containing protein 75 n=1 Tax=Leguminivora glycinivorella TaxID=1035111 RepID=UPI00200DA8DF|nr:WD repeat-containing protein 75 [Leguminivora glycinivorella]